MLAWLALTASAEPPRGEVYASYGGSVDRGFGIVSFQPALVRGQDAEASLVLRGAASTLYYVYMDGDRFTRVRSPGFTMGPGFSWTPNDLTMSASIGFESRATTRMPHLGEAWTELEVDVSLAGQVQWRPGQLGSVYALGSFSAVYENLWMRAGALRSIVPFRERRAPVALWLGAEGTTVGNQDNRVFELNGVAEVPVRWLDTTFSVRGGVASFELGEERIHQPAFGLGIYWRY